MIELNIDQFLTDYSEYLVNGTFDFNENRTQLILHNSNCKFVKDALNQKSGKGSSKTSCTKTVEVCSNSKKFNGELALIPSHQYGIKVFSKTEVLTIYKDTDKLERDIENRKYVSAVFNTPKIIELSNLYIIEERLQEDINITIDIARCIIEKYINYYSNNDNKVINNNEIYPRILQHGDLWSGNIVVQENSLYVLDYETVGERFFLYDFFEFIYNESYIKKDYRYIIKYLSGEYDEQLTRYFMIFNMKYLESHKWKYLHHFCGLLYKERTYMKSLKKRILELIGMKKNELSILVQLKERKNETLR